MLTRSSRRSGRSQHLGVLLTYPAVATNGATATPLGPAPRARRNDRLGIAVVGNRILRDKRSLAEARERPGCAAPSRRCPGRGLSARSAADKFGAARVASDLGAALAMDDVDAVIIATRHDAHAAQAARALDAGRDVFLEKPAAIARSNSRASRARCTVRARGLCSDTIEGSPRSPVSAREAFAGRSAGLVMTARINAGRIPPGTWDRRPHRRRRPNHRRSVHFIDLLSYWAGGPPVRVRRARDRHERRLCARRQHGHRGDVRRREASDPSSTRQWGTRA